MGRRVPPTGPRNAKIVLVGEAPGAEEEAQGVPFVGNSGRLLNDILGCAGIGRGECYITNVVKERPRDNEFGTYYSDSKRNNPHANLINAWSALERELETLTPNVIVALGGEALRAITGKRGIDKWRGSILTRCLGQRDTKVVGTYHPAGVLRQWDWRPIVDLDMRRVRKESFSPKYKPPESRFIVNPSFDQVMDLLGMLRRQSRISFDIETIDKHVRCLGIAWSPVDALCIPFIRKNQPIPQDGLVQFHKGGGRVNRWSFDEELQILERVDDVLGSPEVEKIDQNHPFDSTILLREFGLVVRGLWMDTMVAQHCCYSELPKGLDFLASIYTDIPYWSDYNSENDWSTWVYNCWDCVSTWQVSVALEKEMQALGVWEFYRQHAQPSMEELGRMGNRGTWIDVERRKKIADGEEVRLAEVKKKILRLTGMELNPNSPKQMKEFLYERLKLPVQLHHKRKNATADEAAIEKLMGKFPQHKPLLQTVLDYRGSVKLLGTFLNSELNELGKMETSYNATGTTSGRISSSTTIFGLGGNLQQVPTDGDIRKIFIAEPPFNCCGKCRNYSYKRRSCCLYNRPVSIRTLCDGYNYRPRVLIKADGSQAEARVVAWDGRMVELIEKFLDPLFDIHRYNAMKVFAFEDEASVTKEKRQEVKAIVHGTNYRGSEKLMSRIAKIPLLQARVYYGRYVTDDLRRWWGEVEYRVLSTRRLRNPFGRLHIFFGRVGEDLYRSATADGPQSTVGDLINRGVFVLENELPDGCFPVLQVHDEIVTEAWEDCVDECIPTIKRAFELPIKFEGVDPALVIPVEIKVGKSWGECR